MLLLIVQQVPDMKHRDWTFAKIISFKDKEAKTAIFDRPRILSKFIFQGTPADCTEKLDYQSLIHKYREQVFNNDSD